MKLTTGFAAASLALTASPLMADGPGLKHAGDRPVKVVGTADRNYQTYYMEETVHADRTTSRPRAFVDKVLGLVCEWNEKGRRELDADANFKTVDLRAEQIGCVRTKVPEAWKAVTAPKADLQGMMLGFMMQGAPQQQAAEAARQASEEQRKQTGTATRPAQDLSSVREVIIGGNAHALPHFRITHQWKLDTNEVCLQTLEIPEGESGDVMKVFQQDWGCYPIRKTNYLNRLLGTLGVRPA